MHCHFSIQTTKVQGKRYGYGFLTFCMTIIYIRFKNINVSSESNWKLFLDSTENRNELEEDCGYDTLYCDSIPNVETSDVNGAVHDARQNESEENIVENPYYGLDDVSEAVSNQLSTNEDKNIVTIVKAAENPYYSGI